MLTQVGFVAHAIACVAFAGLALFAARTAGGGAPTRWLVIACALTSAWALTFVLAVLTRSEIAVLLSPAETLRNAGWLAFMAALLSRSWALGERPTSSSASVIVALASVMAGQLALDGYIWLRADAAGPGQAGVYVLLFARLTVAIGGLVLVHNLYVNTAPSSRWSLRLLLIALAGIFGYDLNYYTIILLTEGPAPDLFNIRGLANALVVPLIAISAGRARGWHLKVSREVVFQTFSLAGIGAYLVAMSLLAYGLRLVGGDWGRLLQIGFLFATIICAAVVLFSGRFRAWARVKINKHFFAYKFDYREEWLRFIATLSRSGDGAEPLRARVVQAVCEIVDSPAGKLFLPDEEGAFAPAARWNPLAIEGRFPPDHPLPRGMEETGRIVSLDDLRSGSGEGAGLPLPEWRENRAAWLVVPLIHIDRLAGFIVTARPLAARELNWEDYDLLRTAGRQAASYIAEHEGQQALSEARKFDEFNRRFAFIMHDIKNVASQLSLVARNAERHAENPAFRADMVATLNGSVTRMNDLLARLGEHSNERPAPVARLDLARLLAEVVARKRAHHPVVLTGEEALISVEADGGRLEQAFEHLIQNAIEASHPDVPVEVVLGARDGRAQVEVRDRGCGMSASFVREELFNPFHSTKAGGFGIGAFEAREIVRASGGKLLVDSREGEGSVFTVLLPLARARTPQTAAA